MLPRVLRTVSQHARLASSTATQPRSRASSSNSSSSSAADDFYAVLGVSGTATPAEIKAAFRQLAKQLHPDLAGSSSSTSSTTSSTCSSSSRSSRSSSGEQFLRLVQAYEVLADPQSRLEYDTTGASQSSSTAAAPPAAGTAGGGHDDDSASSLDWRWGLAEWARRGPRPLRVTGTAEDASLRASVASALERHRHELESELHAALMTAYLGPPRPRAKPGELPRALELDERSHPAASPELLHLVHGRELLGCVREPLVLQLASGDGDTTPLLPPAPAAAASGHQIPQGPSADRPLLSAAGTLGAPGAGAAAPRQTGPGSAAGKDPEAEITDAEWRQLLQEQHPLCLRYAWAPAQADSDEEEVQEASHSATSTAAAAAQPGSGCGDGASGQPAPVELPPAEALAGEATLGGRAAREAWERQAAAAARSAAEQGGSVEGAKAAGQAGSQPGALPDPAAEAGQMQLMREQQGEDETQRGSWQHQWHRLDAVQQQRLQQQWWQQWQQQRMQQAGQAAEAAAAAAGRWQRRVWRLVSAPTADWQAANWSFTDADEGVVVLQLLMAELPVGSQVTAVAVRDDRQANKPIKVYVAGEFTAAVLEDVVMQPMTGKLSCVIYRFNTPGVHTLAFYLPVQGASRVLARLQRRWMPPSNTWLFPPRSDTHDRCSWVLEWEGAEASGRRGWLHPATFALVAGMHSLDLERRRVRKQEGEGGSAGGLSAALMAWLGRAWAALRGASSHARVRLTDV